jgi:hypothetical protein
VVIGPSRVYLAGVRTFEISWVDESAPPQQVQAMGFVKLASWYDPDVWVEPPNAAPAAVESGELTPCFVLLGDPAPPGGFPTVCHVRHELVESVLPVASAD